MKKLLNKKAMLVIAPAIALVVATVSAIPVFATGTTALWLHGSTTVSPIMTAAATAFNGANLGVTFAVTTPDFAATGSSAGIGELLATPQTADIAMSSRALKTGSEATNLTAHVIAKDAVIIMVSDTPTPACVQVLTKQMVRGIFQGAYKEADGNQYWDSPAVTLTSGLVGSDGLTYYAGTTFPALPGNGVAGAHVQINVKARNMDSGTRGFLGDPSANGGCNFQKGSTLPAPYEFASSYPLEQALMGIDDVNRQASSGAMQNTINNATNSAIGYAGLGGGRDATHTNVRELAIIDDMAGTDTNAYLPSAINIYSYHYHISRSLYLMTKNGDLNNANEMVLINWMKATDGGGQAAVESKKHLKIFPNQDINTDNVINYLDLGDLGTAYGKTPIAPARADIIRDGTANYLDLGELGNWYGVQIQTLP